MCIWRHCQINPFSAQYHCCRSLKRQVIWRTKWKTLHISKYFPKPSKYHAHFKDGRKQRYGETDLPSTQRSLFAASWKGLSGSSSRTLETCTYKQQQFPKPPENVDSNASQKKWEESRNSEKLALLCRSKQQTQIIHNLGDWGSEEVGCSYTWLTEKTWKKRLFKKGPSTN